MVRKYKLALAIAVFFFSTVSPAIAFPNEPNGFRGWDWGTTLSDAAPWMSSQGFDLELGCEKYSRPQDGYQIGSTALASIYYLFYQNALVGISFTATSIDTRLGLYTELFSRFGDPDVSSAWQYQWLGKETTIISTRISIPSEPNIGAVYMLEKAFYDLYLKRRQVQRKDW